MLQFRVALLICPYRVKKKKVKILRKVANDKKVLYFTDNQITKK